MIHNDFFRPIQMILAKYKGETHRIKDELSSIFVPFEMEFKENGVLKENPLEGLIKSCIQILNDSPKKARSYERLEEMIDGYIQNKRRNTVAFDERIARIPREKMNFYFVRCEADEFVWMSDNLKSRNFINFDLWARFHEDKKWICSEIAKQCNGNKKRFDSICFVKKKSSGVNGPLLLAKDISKKIYGKPKYLVYDANTKAITDQNRNAYRKANSNVCIVYDLVCSGEGLMNVYKNLCKQRILVNHAMLLYDYGLQHFKFPFQTQFIINDPYLSQRNLSLRFDKDLQKLEPASGGWATVTFSPEDEAYGSEIIFRFGPIRYLSKLGKFIVPSSSLKILDKKKVRYESRILDNSML